MFVGTSGEQTVRGSQQAAGGHGHIHQGSHGHPSQAHGGCCCTSKVSSLRIHRISGLIPVPDLICRIYGHIMELAGYPEISIIITGNNLKNIRKVPPVDKSIISLNTFTPLQVPLHIQ
jgi:hypothetical protein